MKKDTFEQLNPTSTSDIIFKDERTPYSKRFGDFYFSSVNGLEEAQYVFLTGNGLPQRWQQKKSFTIAEAGFGAGLNFLVTWKLFDETGFQGGKLHYFSVECYPLTLEDIKLSVSYWPELDSYYQELSVGYAKLKKGFNRILLSGERVILNILVGDINDILEELDVVVDVWFLDGFSPAKNPSMWSQGLFEQMKRLSKVGTSLATFSAASMVSNGLTAAGFSVTKRPGYGRKREMITGVMV